MDDNRPAREEALAMGERRSTEGSDHGLTRREFLGCTALTSAALLTGCAVNPVTGEQQLMLVGEATEIQVDRDNSPYQFSADYGAVRDPSLNAYIDGVGRKIAVLTHRPAMPYSFRAVNAAYVNAYAFPGGSIALTRGILLNMESEAELAGLIGHELGHVNARHTARQMTKGMVTSLVLAGVAIAVAGQDESAAELVAGLGGIAAGALLAHYSRDNERQADELGMEYMTRAGYSPQGLIDLMEMLRSLHKREPNALELMFSTHPMSSERYDMATRRASASYAAEMSLPMGRESYLDHIAGIRAQKELIESVQKGEKAIAAEKYGEAETILQSALQQSPDDYTALLLMAKCQLVLEKSGEAERHADAAHQVYPEEPQALQVRGVARLRGGRYDEAYADFAAYASVLPGNPNTTFYQGFSLEKMGRRDEAARRYSEYLNVVQQGEKAAYAAGRLREWGYLR
jgi:predicted Zn-dependent protease